MKNDLLDDAVLALRSEAPGEPTGKDATRARIAGTIRTRRRRRAHAVRASTALLCAALGSTAWAAATGRLPHLSKVVELLGAAPRTDSDPDLPPPHESAPKQLESAPAKVDVPNGEEQTFEPTVKEPAPTADSEVVNEAPRAIEAPQTVKPATPKPSAMPATGTKEAPASTGAESKKTSAPSVDAATEALYLRAHELHFQAHDYARARSAWEAYLKEAPSGRFAAFAHYNRALCLVRLGRIGEAKLALEPFASGAFGGYRKAEAASLLEALGSAQPVIKNQSND